MNELKELIRLLEADAPPTAVTAAAYAHYGDRGPYGAFCAAYFKNDANALAYLGHMLQEPDTGPAYVRAGLIFLLTIRLQELENAQS
jgi:hypothetical protein